MSKTDTKDELQEQATTSPAETTTQAPGYIEQLKKDGHVTLSAPTMDALTAMVDNIPANISYGAGAIGRNYEQGVFTLRIDIVKPKNK